MMMYPGIMQFKMTNGEEIICQVLEYPEEEDTDYVVKNALSMITKTVGTSHTKYMFKPWFTMAEREDQYISIAKDHIVACVSPNTKLYSEYRKARREMHLNSRARPQTEEQIVDDQKNQYVKMHDEIMALIDEMEKQTEEESFSLDDSDGGSNIIKFPGPDSIH
jgi:hypothetical protein